MESQPEALDHLVTWYRDLIMLHQGAPAKLLTHVHHAEELRQLATHYSRLQLQSAIKAIFETKAMLQRNVNATLALEVLALKLLAVAILNVQDLRKFSMWCGFFYF